MEGWVAVTHSDWFDLLARQPRRDEVNFWSPSDYYAFHGSPGAPFFFKLKAPRNAIGGFGYVASFSRLPEWLAWECFGEGNGAETLHDLRSRLGAIRERNELRGAGGPSQIGCIVIVQATFFPPDQWIPQPTDWATRNLRYKKYDLSQGEGARIWRECQERAESAKLRGEYANGRTYYPMHGAELSAPAAAMVRPDAALLRWHNDTVFRG